MSKLILAVLFSASLFAQDQPRPSIAFRISVGALVAGQALDAFSTFDHAPGLVETNPLGSRGVVIGKIALTGGILGAEWLMRKHPRKYFTWLNFGAGGLGAAEAAHNWSLK